MIPTTLKVLLPIDISLKLFMLRVSAIFGSIQTLPLGGLPLF